MSDVNPILYIQGECLQGEIWGQVTINISAVSVKLSLNIAAHPAATLLYRNSAASITMGTGRRVELKFIRSRNYAGL